MDYAISNKTKDHIATLANAQPDKEVCGYWIPSIDLVYPVENISENPVDRFEIDIDLHLKMMNRYHDAIIYHSHVGENQSSTLSTMDILNSKKLRVPYLVYHQFFAEWDYYDPLSLDPYPLMGLPYIPESLEFYLGRPWQWERFDCFTLLRNYYRGMLGIKLDDFSRLGEEDCITDPQWNQFIENYENQGFRKLETDEPIQNNDVFLMNMVGKQIHHCAVVIDSKTHTAIHILGENFLSKKFKYGKYTQECTKLIVRYQKATVN